MNFNPYAFPKESVTDLNTSEALEIRTVARELGLNIRSQVRGVRLGVTFTPNDKVEELQNKLRLHDRLEITADGVFVRPIST